MKSNFRNLLCSGIPTIHGGDAIDCEVKCDL